MWSESKCAEHCAGCQASQSHCKSCRRVDEEQGKGGGGHRAGTTGEVGQLVLWEWRGVEGRGGEAIGTVE